MFQKQVTLRLVAEMQLGFSYWESECCEVVMVTQTHIHIC